MRCLGYLCVRSDVEKSQPFSEALSVCEDYCDHFLNTWCLDWVSEPCIPSDISQSIAQAMISECTPLLGKTWEWPSIATDLEWLKNFHYKWGKLAGCRLVALGCDETDLARMVEATRPPLQQPGYAAWGPLGHHIMAQRDFSVDPTWAVLGWEVLEANPSMLGDCHTDIAGADPITGLMPDLKAARTFITKLEKEPSNAHSVFIPIAIVAIPEVDLS